MSNIFRSDNEINKIKESKEFKDAATKANDFVNNKQFQEFKDKYEGKSEEEILKDAKNMSKKLKQQYGDKLVLHGGVNAVLWDDIDAITAEIEHLVPILKQNGGYIFSSDHSIPNSVSLENFKHIVATVKKCGRY